jgi:Ran GTPase-activating protein (RanGAP) involved in mRNA processing and transport
LQILNLNNTDLKTSAVTYIAIKLRNQSSLQNLQIAKPLLHSLQEDTCVHLGETLRSNTVLTSLDLSHHGIRTEGITLLTRGLLNNSSIQHLKLTGYCLI